MQDGDAISGLVDAFSDNPSLWDRAESASFHSRSGKKPDQREKQREEQREKNREAQRKCRARVKAELTSAVQRHGFVSRQLAAMRIGLAAKREQRRALRDRITAQAALDPASLLDDAAPAQAEPDHDPRRHSSSAAKTLHPERRASARSPAGAQEPVLAIFRERRPDGAPLSRAVTLSLLVMQGEGPLFERLNAFQAAEACSLGCEVEDVAWLWECSFRPAITRDAPIPSNLHPSGCKAQASLAWMAARVECAMLLAMWRRLDAAIEGLPSGQAASQLGGRPTHGPCADHSDAFFHSAQPQGGIDPGESGSSRRGAFRSASSLQSVDTSDLSSTSAFTADQSSRAAVERLRQAAPEKRASHRPRASDCSTGNSDASGADADRIEELSDRVFAFLLTDSAACAPLLRPATVARPPSQLSRLECWNHPGALARFVGLVRQVLGGIFAEYVPLMHPADVVLLARRLVWAHESPPSAQHAFDRAAPLTSGTGVAALMLEVVSLARQAMRGACANPRVPPLPTTRDAATRRKLAIEDRMGAVYADWTLLYTVAALGLPQWLYQAASGFNPAVAGGTQFEQQNLKAYATLDLSTEQKRTIAAAWQYYRARLAELSQARASLACKLAALPSADDFVEILGWAAEESGCPALSPRRRSSQPQTGAREQPPDALTALYRFFQKPRPSMYSAALRAAASSAPGGTCSGPGLPSGGRGFEWARQLLGASPDVTVEAAEVLEGVQWVHHERHKLYVEFLCVFKHVLLPVQQASWFTAQLPFVGDSHKIAVMASSDLGRDRVYGRAALCGF